MRHQRHGKAQEIPSKIPKNNKIYNLIYKFPCKKENFKDTVVQYDILLNLDPSNFEICVYKHNILHKIKYYKSTILNLGRILTRRQKIS
jgi:hypothetical protein